MSWTNWARTVACDPVEVAWPTSTAEVAAVVRAAADRGLSVKAIGAGHSFSGIAEAPGVQVSLDEMQGLVAVDPARRRVTLRAGTRLHRLPDLLAPLGLAMENLGDIDRQSIAGAIATSTHGTGLAFGGLATQVVGLELVDGRGRVRRFGEANGDGHADGAGDAGALAGAAVSLGALGIVTEVTLQCVDRFVLAAVETPEPLDAVLDAWGERVAGADHFEAFWFPHTARALTKSQERQPATARRRPLGRVRRFVDDDLVANRLFGATSRVCAAVPAAVPTVNRLANRLTGDRAMTDWSTSIYTTRRTTRFKELEYSVPLAALPDAVREIRALIERRRWRISWPLELRAAAGDDRWLSTAYGRDSGYVAVHRFHREDERAYFREVEQVLWDHDGRPHWGKMHTRTRAELAGRYPRLGDFRALRDELDPDRRFANPYLDRVLGR